MASVKQQLWENDGLNLALQGLPGMGKTALAVALTADPAVRDRFKDGMLWAGLGQQPDVQGHLARWGKLLGVSPSTMGDVNSQASWGQALRAAIGKRRMLLVIDDAWDGEDALAFQIGGERCAHLLTSRLPHVAFAFAGERVLTVPELTQADGLALLARYVPTVVAQDRENAQALVQAVGSSPLALTLMGSYLATQAFTGQARRVRDALAQLKKTERRLHVSVPTAVGRRPANLPPDIPFSLHSVIALSDQRLANQTRAALRALAVFPPKPNSFSEEAALAVSADAVETLDELWDAGLLESSGAGFYTLHQTIVDFALMQGKEIEARLRLVAYMIWFVRAHEEDYDALEREQSNILAALDALVAFQRGDYPQAKRVLENGLHLARSLGDRERICTLLIHLGGVLHYQGDFSQTETLYQEALALARQFFQSRMGMVHFFEMLRMAR